MAIETRPIQRLKYSSSKAAASNSAKTRPFGPTNLFSTLPYEPEYVRKVKEWFRKNDEQKESRLTKSVDGAGEQQ
ncbi:hypothetical protein Q1695_009695 [Nippostrongylus brasiliensis]|nr:hypothetical protein Q1695_009695 [Nippostrongylus brasiliensis]